MIVHFNLKGGGGGVVNLAAPPRNGEHIAFPDDWPDAELAGQELEVKGITHEAFGRLGVEPKMIVFLV